MCIRDRVDAVSKHCHPQIAAMVRLQLATGMRPGDVCSIRSVSYTHLRAHETVLDLVCRLLLEKKNIAQFRTYII